ncbi:MAG: hypothetical protein EZS28_035529, partial [Streblomastix strix]
IYEGVRPLIFHGRGVVRDNSGENEISQQFKDGEVNLNEEKVEIAEGFQIFITSNDLKKLSPALRSRCFCIQMETAHDEVQLKELSESVLNQSDVGRDYSIPISLILSKTFCHAREMSKTRKLLFSKDTFSPHRIINSARGIGNEKITAINIASGIQMSFIQCFKSKEDQKEISINSKEIIKKINDESATVVGHLARSDLDINMYINDAPLLEKDNKTVQIILRKNQNAIIRFGEHEIPVQIAEVSKFIPTNQLQITSLFDIDLSSLTEKTHYKIHKLKGLSAEQKLWVLADVFAEIPIDLITQNEILSELIQSIRQFRIKAIQIEKAPFGASLLPLNPQQCEKAFEIATADQQRLQSSTQQLNAFLQSVKRRKDIDTDSVKIPQIVEKYTKKPKYDNAITALIEFSLREEAISKAAEDTSFENIISDIPETSTIAPICFIFDNLVIDELISTIIETSVSCNV